MEEVKKVLITGSSGMLGSALCLSLAKEFSLFGLDAQDAPDLRIASERFVKADITQVDSFSGDLLKIQPDIVIHAAGFTDVDACQLDPDKAYSVNSEGTRKIALACRKNNSFLIYLSTDYIFDGEKRAPYTEADQSHPINVYGDSKLKGEAFIGQILNDYLIVRTSWLYGARGRNFVDTIINRAASGQKLQVVNDQIGSPTYARDLAQAIGGLICFRLKRVSPLPHKIYHITNSGSCSWFNLAKTVLEYKNAASRQIEPITSLELARPAPRPKMSILDNGRYNGLTAKALRNWQEALKDYLS